MCQICIDHNKKMEEFAETYYKNAGNDLNNAIFDMRNIDFDRKMENYLLFKYAPERWQARMEEGFKQLRESLSKNK